MDPVVCVLNFVVNKVLVRAVAKVIDPFGRRLRPLARNFDFTDGRRWVTLEVATDIVSSEIFALTPASQKWFDC